MAVTRDDVRKVAELARLELSADEIETLTGDLNRILEHVDALAAVDLESIEAAATGAGPEPLPRTALDADSAGPDPLTHGPERFAPAFPDRHFAVPRPRSQDDRAGADG